MHRLSYADTHHDVKILEWMEWLEIQNIEYLESGV